MTRKHPYTHWGWLRGCDCRTPDGTKHKVRLRKGKVHWITEKGSRFLLKNGWGVGDWPLYALEMDTVKELDQPVRR